MANNAIAQSTFLPILEEGKRWTYINYAVSGELHKPATPWTWEIIDMVETDGHRIFTLLYKHGATNDTDINFEFTKNEYEEDGVLWSFSDEECRYQPLIDFKLDVGDEIEEGFEAVIWKDVVVIEGVERCVIALKSPWAGKVSYWIEGIGAIDDVYLSPVIMSIGERTRMTECWVGDTCLFDITRLDDYLSEVDLSEVESMARSVETVPIYDMMGRIIATPAPGQLYIQGGKKHIAK